MSIPLFTLVILGRKASHLLPLTLDSLKPQNEPFEVILFGTHSLKELIKRYPELQIQLHAPITKLGEMMNRAVTLSRGKYIQFLEPGDRYISQYGLAFLSQLIVKEPPLISARGMSQEVRTHWFLKRKIQELGGFDERLPSRPMLDLLCRIEKQKAESIFCRRVIVDSPSKTTMAFRETCRVFYRHYGLRHTLRWIFLQDRTQLLQRMTTFLKQAFWQHD